MNMPKDSAFQQTVCSHAELNSRTEFAFIKKQIVPLKDANINIMSQAFLFGTAIHEGLRGYYNAHTKQIYMFRLRDHFERMYGNQTFLKMFDTHRDVEYMCNAVLQLIRANQFKADCYVRAVIYKSSLQMSLQLLDEQDFALVAIEQGRFTAKKSLSVCVSSWRRVQDNAIPARGKINGAYVNSCLAMTQAKDSGFDDAIFLNEDGTVSEGTGANLFIVRNGKLITPPLTSNILEGVTRDTICAIAKYELQIDVEERPINRTELYVADELFLCGTAIEVMSVGKVDNREIGGATNYPITAKIQKCYEQIVRGENTKYHKWLFPIYQPENEDIEVEVCRTLADIDGN